MTVAHAEAKQLAGVLRNMIECGAAPADLWTQSQPDGDSFVARAAELLELFASEARPGGHGSTVKPANEGGIQRKIGRLRQQVKDLKDARDHWQALANQPREVAPIDVAGQRVSDAARAVLERWDTPKWKWAHNGPTADLMRVLRCALAGQAPSVAPANPASVALAIRNIGRDIFSRQHGRADDPRVTAGQIAAWFEALPAAPAERPSREDLIAALKFYAKGEHFHLDESDEFDSVSGEPQNWQCSGRDDSSTMVEDGTIARMTLDGKLTAAQIEAADGEPAPAATQAPVAATTTDSEGTPA